MVLRVVDLTEAQLPVARTALPAVRDTVPGPCGPVAPSAVCRSDCQWPTSLTWQLPNTVPQHIFQKKKNWQCAGGAKKKSTKMAHKISGNTFTFVQQAVRIIRILNGPPTRSLGRMLTSASNALAKMLSPSRTNKGTLHCLVWAQ